MKTSTTYFRIMIPARFSVAWSVGTISMEDIRAWALTEAKLQAPWPVGKVEVAYDGRSIEGEGNPMGLTATVYPK